MKNAREFVNPFSFNTSASIRFGSGVIAELATAFHLDSHSNVMVVTDPGIVKTNLIGYLLSPLHAAGIAPLVYDKVLADPPERIVLEAADMARAGEVTAVIGFGGGSSLDVAKLVAILATGDQQLQDIYGINAVKRGRLKLALIPTTAGTGSEVTPIAVVTTGASEKKAVSSPVLLPDLALLDPDLTLTLPPLVTAATGIDAMVHAIEAYTSANVNNNLLSKILARNSLSLLAGAIRTAVSNGSDPVVRGRMLFGSMLAGQAFANSPVAAVHALAYPLGGRYHLPHGITNALVLPHVLRFNASVCGNAYGELAAIAFPHLAGLAFDRRRFAFIDELAALAREIAIPQRLRDVGVDRSHLSALADDAMKQTRLLVNNPKLFTRDDIFRIYEAAW